MNPNVAVVNNLNELVGFNPSHVHDLISSLPPPNEVIVGFSDHQRSQNPFSLMNNHHHHVPMNYDSIGPFFPVGGGSSNNMNNNSLSESDCLVNSSSPQGSGTTAGLLGNNKNSENYVLFIIIDRAFLLHR